MTVQDTSIKTYHEIISEGLLGDRQVEVYELLAKNVPLTDMEITQKLGKKDPNYVRPRRKELVDMGIVEDAGKRKCSITNRDAYQWQIVEKAAFKKLVKKLLKKDKIECAACHGKGWIDRRELGG